MLAKNFIRIVLSLLVIWGFFITEANAGSVPRPIASEKRIKIINYMPNTVFKFVGHYEYQSIIEFSDDEEIDTISMGTPTPWQLVPAGNRIFIKPVEDNATTNMTVITNKRMYFFEMHAEDAAGLSDENLNFIVKFVYPDQFSGLNLNKAVMGSTAKSGPDLSDPTKYNFNYTIAGAAKQIEPLQIFDDGEFTYFKFQDVNAELPAVFGVDSGNLEGLVNFRITGGYLVVEKVIDRFTLRHGDDVLCVFNNKIYKKRIL